MRNLVEESLGFHGIMQSHSSMSTSRPLHDDEQVRRVRQRVDFPSPGVFHHHPGAPAGPPPASLAAAHVVSPPPPPMHVTYQNCTFSSTANGGCC
jgi:hypothetical protein